MADKLVIVLANANPDEGSELGAPLFQATVAAAMEYQVEMVFTGRAGKLAINGVATALTIPSDSARTVYDLIKDAREAGVEFKVCTPTLDLWGEDLIPEIGETVGGAYVISEAMDDNTVTFTY